MTWRKGYIGADRNGKLILTPSRLEDDSSCRICNDGSRNSLGHRAWHCIATEREHKRLGLDNFDEASQPRCFTRSGVVPLHSGMSPTLIQAVQEMLVVAAKHFAYNDERFINMEADKARLMAENKTQQDHPLPEGTRAATSGE